MSTKPVRKAVIPAAGLGTRFLPVTKAVPKELLPLVDRPSIEHVVEEAALVGCSDVLVVTGRGKGAIEDHFDRNVELEEHLEQAGKVELLERVRASSTLADVHFVRQHEPLGLGHAVGVARHHVGDESFAVLLGDDVMVDDAALLRAMLDVHRRLGGSVLALIEVTPEQISAYASAMTEDVEPGIKRVRGVVEKPPPEEAPSNLAVIGRYVFTPGIFDALDRTAPGFGGELQLTDAIEILLHEEPVFGVVFSEGRYDAGDRLDYLRANVELALARPDLGPALGAYLAELVRARGLG